MIERLEGFRFFDSNRSAASVSTPPQRETVVRMKLSSTWKAPAFAATSRSPVRVDDNARHNGFETGFRLADDALDHASSTMAEENQLCVLSLMRLFGENVIGHLFESIWVEGGSIADRVCAVGVWKSKRPQRAQRRQLSGRSR